MKGQKVWKFAHIDPKRVSIRFAYMCHSCADKKSRGPKETRDREKAGISPTDVQVAKVWAGVMRMQRERGVANVS
jgi:hypothetical protein